MHDRSPSAQEQPAVVITTTGDPPPKIIAVQGDDGVLVTGEPGDPGEPGEPGRRGPQGFPGPQAPRPPIAATILARIRDLCFVVAILMSLWIAVDKARDENRLVADRDALRTELGLLRQENELERVSDACFDALTAEITRTNQASGAISTLIDVGEIRGLLTFLPDPPPEAELDPDTLLDLAGDADVAARANLRAIEARRAWTEGGRPLPCPIATTTPTTTETTS